MLNYNRYLVKIHPILIKYTLILTIIFLYSDLCEYIYILVKRKMM